MFKNSKKPDYYSVITEYQNLRQAVIRCIEAKNIIRLVEGQYKSGDCFINKIMFNEDIYSNTIQSVTAEICSHVLITESCPVNVMFNKTTNENVIQSVPKEICSQLCYQIQRKNSVKTYKVLENITIPFEEILEFCKN